MAADDATVAAPPRVGLRRPRRRGAVRAACVTLWLSVIVLIPLAAVVEHSLQDGLGAFWDAITEPRGGRGDQADADLAR